MVVYDAVSFLYIFVHNSRLASPRLAACLAGRRASAVYVALNGLGGVAAAESARGARGPSGWISPRPLFPLFCVAVCDRRPSTNVVM